MRARHALVPLIGSGRDGDSFRPDLPDGTPWSGSIPTDADGHPVSDLALVHLWGGDDLLGEVDAAGVVFARHATRLDELPVAERRRLRAEMKRAGRPANVGSGALVKHLIREGGRVLEPHFHESNLLAGPPELAGGADLSDTFTRASDNGLAWHTSDSGHTWTTYLAAGLANAYVFATPDSCGGSTGMGSCGNYSSWVPADAEYQVGFDVVYKDNTACFAGVWGRAETAANTGYVAFIRPDNGTSKLLKYVAGVSTELGAWTPGLQSYTGNYLKLWDSVKKFWVAGSLKVSSTDNAITAAGRVGTYLYQATATSGVHLDNLAGNDAITPDPASPAGPRRRPLGLYTR